MERQADYPFGLDEARAAVALYSETFKLPDDQDDRYGRLWRSMNASYILKLNIKSADKLAKKDFFGLSDPYVKFSIQGGEDMEVFPHFISLDDHTPMAYKTRVIHKTLHPKWKQKFHFSMTSPVGSIILDVYDKNVLIPDDFLGRVYVPFNLTATHSENNFPLDSDDYPITLQLALKEKYQWDVLTRVSHLQAIYSHLSAKKTLGTLKDHKITGNLILEVSFHRRQEVWQGLIDRYIETFQTTRQQRTYSMGPRRTSGLSHSIGGLFSSLVDTVRSYRSSHEDRSDDEESDGESDDDSDNEEEPLPEGWEERIDSNRRRMFVNHGTRRVSMRRPQETQQSSSQQPRVFLPRSHSIEEEPVTPVAAAPRTSRTSNLDVPESRQRAHSITRDTDIRVEEHFGQQTGNTSSLQSRPQQGLRRTGSFDEASAIGAATERRPQQTPQQTPQPRPRRRQRAGSMEETRWEFRSTPQGTNFAGFVNLDDVTPSADVVEQTRNVDTEQTEQSIEITVPTAPPLQDLLAQESNIPTTAPTGPRRPESEGLLESTTSAPEQPQQSMPQPQAEALPPGWQAAVTSDGRTFYIDHSTETTSWVHPARREAERRTETTSASASAGIGIEQDVSLPPGWEQRQTPDGRAFYIDHNTRTTTWEHPQRHSASKGPLPRNWEAGQLPDGRVFYMNHITKETQWADPRISHQAQQNQQAPKIQYDRNYKQKYMNFKASLKPKHTIPNQVKLSVKRTNLLETSYESVMRESDPEKLKSRLYIQFEGESGLDYGGLAREWFYLLSHEMFNPYYGLFEYSASDDYTLQINPYSHLCNDNHLRYFKFIGRVCGMAVYHSKLVDAYFIRPFYKMMLRKKIALADMQAVDVEFYNSLRYILNNDPEPLCLQFSTTKDFLGEITEVDLKPNGCNIPVTESNKTEYVDLMLKWRFVDRVRDQMDSFMEGFSELIPSRLLSVFDERELEYLLCGLSAIDTEDWKKYTEYIDYKSTDTTILWFWIAVERFDNETRARLLQFVTGTSKVPMNGFRELQGSNGPKKFTIKKTGSPDSLPVSHTCFNRLDLPPYQTYFALKDKLTLAVENTEGFDIQ